MTTTIHERGTRDAMERFLKNVPVGGAVLAKLMEDIRSGHYPTWYLDTICQPWRTFAGGAWPMEQVFAFMFIDDWVQRGALAVVDIEVGHEPHADSLREENQAALDNLADPYVAIVDQTQHCAIGDGVLKWDGRIGVSFRADPGEWNAADKTDWVIGALEGDFVVPLEIGSTLATTSVGHLSESRALARWPYGHTSIRLFIDTDLFKPYAEDRNGTVRRFSPPKPMDRRTLPLPEKLKRELAARPEDLARTEPTDG